MRLDFAYPPTIQFVIHGCILVKETMYGSLTAHWMTVVSAEKKPAEVTAGRENPYEFNRSIREWQKFGQ